MTPVLSRSKQLVFRFVAIGAVLALGYLIFEGASALVAGRGILSGSRDDGGPLSVRMRDDERRRIAGTSAGPYAASIDPWVASEFKADATWTFLGQPAHMDARGLRRRAGPPAEPGALRLVVLGDSVAFGFGIRDDETFAERLEAILAAALPSGGVRPFAQTVAVPGWNFDNARRYLLDHLDELDPDLVLWIPVQNDLDDGNAVVETGHRDPDTDPAREARWPHVSVGYHYAMTLARHKPSSSTPLRFSVGLAMMTGVTPESRRRYDAILDGLVDLDGRLAARGARFALVLRASEMFEGRLLQFMSERSLALPHLTLFASLGREEMLGGDPHFNARATRTGAIRIARFLAASGLVDGLDPARLPQEDASFASNRVGARVAEETIAARASWDEAARAAVVSRIDVADEIGLDQLYGGVWPDGIVGISCFAALRMPTARAIEIDIERLSDAGGLHPITLDITVAGRRLAPETLEAGALGAPHRRIRRELPADLSGAAFHEVLLVASNWKIDRSLGTSRLASFRLRSLALTD